jgi:hypothetical protein
VGGRLRVGNVVALHADAVLGAGSAQVAAGGITVGAATAGIGVGFTTSGTTELEIGPWLRAGYGWATGSSDLPGVRTATYGNAIVIALLDATLRIHTQSPWTALMGIEIGHAIDAVQFLSDTSKVAGIGSVMIGARAGVAFDP